MNRVLITGANGFVGREAVAVLMRAGYTVRAAVRHASRAEGLPCEAAVVGEIGPETQWSGALRDADVVLHLAGRAHVTRDRSGGGLTDYRRVNVDGTARLASEAARCGIRKFVYASSVKVNGERTAARAFNELDPPAPEDPYGLSKMEAERELWRIAAQSRMAATVVRPVLVYGPEVRANFLTLMNAVYRGWPLPLARVENRRSMVGIGNLVDLLLRAIEHPAAAGQTYLVSDADDDSSPGWVRRIGGALGVPPRLIAVPVPLFRAAASALGRRGAADRLCGSLQVDCGKAMRELAWRPPVSVAGELRRTAEWFLNGRARNN